MFSCHYDGCDSESDTLSSDSELDPIKLAKSKHEAKKFEDLMNTELDETANRFCLPKDKKEGVKQVHFVRTSDEETNENEQDNMFYDEAEDDSNAQWVNEHIPGGLSGSSDAVLNCPCCMTVLAVNCRRHPKFRTKYTSQFPVHCVVDETCVLPNLRVVRAKRRKCDSSQLKTPQPGNCPNPCTQKHYAVKCDICGVVVGSKPDTSDVIQFSNVLASHT